MPNYLVSFSVDFNWQFYYCIRIGKLKETLKQRYIFCNFCNMQGEIAGEKKVFLSILFLFVVSKQRKKKNDVQGNRTKETTQARIFSREK